jgi:hypothetical protein
MLLHARTVENSFEGRYRWIAPFNQSMGAKRAAFKGMRTATAENQAKRKPCPYRIEEDRHSSDDPPRNFTVAER